MERASVAIAFFISHPEVAVDPAVPITRWHLAESGIRRMRAFAASPELRGRIRRVGKR